MEIITAENLTFAYPHAQDNILDGVDFSVEEGEIVLLCGESGSGKTTFLRHLKPSIAPVGEKGGRVFFCGEDMQKLCARTVTADIGFVFQNPDEQIVCDRVFAEMAFGLENLGCPSEKIRGKVAEMAAFFGIEHYFEKNTYNLSGGQKQLLNLASILLTEPRLLILDEPTTGLDPISAGKFLSVIERLNRETGITVILCEHNLNEVYPLASRVCVMEKGKILFNGSTRKAAMFLFEKNNPMAEAMPDAARIAHAVGYQGSCIPVSVKECRNMIAEKEKNIPAEDAHRQTVGAKAFSVKDVYFSYERNAEDVIAGAGLEGYKGELLALLGGNGAGKTTLLKILAGVKNPYRGKLKRYSHTAVYLPQEPVQVFLKDTLHEDFAFMCSQRGRNMQDMYKILEEYTFFQIMPLLMERNPLDLSEGEKQRAALAKLLLLDADIFLLDEPTKGLDAYAKKELAELFAQLKKKGKCIVSVTHDLNFAAEYADRCAMMFAGKCLPASPPRVFFSQNSFYTTHAARIAKGMLYKAVTCEEVVRQCKKA